MNIIDEIKFHYKHCLQQHNRGENYLDSIDSRIRFFRKLFIFHFLDGDDKQNRTEIDANGGDDDDLLFFIYKLNESFMENIKIDVFRKSTKNLPLSNTDIDWPRTTFLNIILQKLNYQLYFTILTRTSANHYHVLSKQKIPVFSSPSEHSVLFKEKLEQYTYPMINFHVDNYDEFLFENVLNYLEIIYIELLVSPNNHSSSTTTTTKEEPTVLLSFTLNYESIDNAYCEKKSMINGQYLSIAKVRDSQTNGYGEVVIRRKIQRSISDNSSNKLNLASFDYPDNLFLTKIRSLNNSPNHHSSSPLLLRPSTCLMYDDNCLIFDSQDLLSELDNENSNQLWLQKGFSQLYFRWKNKQKKFSNSYHCFITKISIPCDKIIEKILSSSSNNCRKSILM